MLYLTLLHNLFCRRQEVVNQATFLYTMSCRWVTVRMEFLGVLVMAVAAYSVILVSHDDAGELGVGVWGGGRGAGAGGGRGDTDTI